MQYARVFVLGRPFQPSHMSASKAAAYPSEATFRCSTLGLAPSLNGKDLTRLESPSKDKNSASLCKKRVAVQNKFNLILQIFWNEREHYNYIQSIQIKINWKLFTKDN